MQTSRTTTQVGTPINIRSTGDIGVDYRIEIGALATLRISMPPGITLQIIPKQVFDLDVNIDGIHSGGIGLVPHNKPDAGDA